MHTLQLLTQPYISRLFFQLKYNTHTNVQMTDTQPQRRFKLGAITELPQVLLLSPLSGHCTPYRMDTQARVVRALSVRPCTCCLGE